MGHFVTGSIRGRNANSYLLCEELREIAVKKTYAGKRMQKIGSSAQILHFPVKKSQIFSAGFQHTGRKGLNQIELKILTEIQF